MKPKEQIIITVIDVMKDEIMSCECGSDWSRIEQLLMNLPIEALIAYLPEDLQGWAKTP